MALPAAVVLQVGTGGGQASSKQATDRLNTLAVSHEMQEKPGSTKHSYGLQVLHLQGCGVLCCVMWCGVVLRCGMV